MTPKLKDVELYLFDLDGTVNMGEIPLEGAIDTLKKLDSLGKKVAFVTNNSSKSLDTYMKKMKRMGYDAEEWQIISSSMSTVHYMKKHYKGKKLYVVGIPYLVDEFKAAGFEVCEDADVVVLSYDITLTYDKLLHACILLHNPATGYIATHPDITCPSNIGDMPDIGAFMSAIGLTTGGRQPSVICGKPYFPMAEFVTERFNTPPHKIAMIGDRLYTDIPFGLNNGFVSVLVLTGETTLKMLEESGVKPDYVLPSINQLIE
jgi:HAD superfamily hydrolase (TIGR01450 family)